jgi:hypothetical protein
MSILSSINCANKKSVIMSRLKELSMSSNVVQLPRPQSQRPATQGLGFYVRVNRSDHVELLHLLRTGETGIFGFVIDAHNIKRHQDLVTEARRHDLDVILDPKTQQMSFPGAHTEVLAALPWGLERHHNVTDFDGEKGQRRAAQIVEAAAMNGFTQILGPTHLLSSPNDPWLRRDIAMMNWTADQIARTGTKLDLIYSLAVPMTLLRDSVERRAIIAGVADAPCTAIWLKVENFGDDATGEKVAAYIDACRDFHARGLPLIGDYIGGLPGLGALAFGAVGGIAQGVTMQQNFKASGWRRPRVKGSGGPSWRVYIPQLDLLLRRNAAQNLLAASAKIKAMCGCRDTHCCPHGPGDMLNHPARHAIYQRAREIERLSSVPESVRAGQYLNQNVRRASDDVAHVAAIPFDDPDLARVLREKQREMSRFRPMMAHLLESIASPSVAMAPPRRQMPKSG